MSQTHVKSDRESSPSMPRWVKVFGVVALTLVLLVGILHLTGHSPGGHTHTLEHSVQQP